MGDTGEDPGRGTEPPIGADIGVGRGWNVDDEPTTAPAADGDSAWAHQIVAPDGEVASIRVTIFGTAKGADVAERVKEALRTAGRTEVERVLAWVDWVHPPREIVFHAASHLPDIQTGDGVWMRAVPVPVG